MKEMRKNGIQIIQLTLVLLCAFTLPGKLLASVCIDDGVVHHNKQTKKKKKKKGKSKFILRVGHQMKLKLNSQAKSSFKMMSKIISNRVADLISAAAVEYFVTRNNGG